METSPNLPVPKTVSTDTKVSASETVITSSIRYTCDAVIRFENEVKDAPRRIDPYSGRRTRILPKGAVQGLKEGAQSFYDRALLAEAKCDANLNRALLAESQNKTSLYGGLAGGVVIGAGVVGLIIYIRKRRREKRQSGNQ